MKNNYKIYIISLGCPKNQVDCEIMVNKLISGGFTIADSIEASDAVLINTCAFIEDAKTEAIETILEVAEYKKAGIISAIIVTGCLSERYQDEVIREMHEVDAVIGIGADKDIVKVCMKALSGVSTSFFPSKDLLPLSGERTLFTPPHWAYLKLSEGCSNRCSYCAIPGIRGNYRERDMESIISEAKELVSRGVKEIVLVAQDTTKYGISLYGEYRLASLLKELCKIKDLRWIRLFYCYPDKVTDELIDTIAEEEKVCSYIDIPLQHCSGEVLRNMNRSGNYDELKTLINKMKERIPGISLRTTLMVGFPGETDEQFEELCKFVKEMKFDKMGCFKFSPEEDTPAYDMKNQIDDSVKACREEVIMDIQYSVTEAANKARVGKEYDAVIDSFDGVNYIGRSYLDAPEIDSGIIISSADKLAVGDFIKVKITDYNGYDLIGEKVQ